VVRMTLETIRIRFEETVCFVQFDRAERNNAINDQLIDECHQVLDLCDQRASVIVMEGSPAVFCMGADFQGMRDMMANGHVERHDPERMYHLWQRLASGPYVTVAHVRGRANAGGVGFVAASDIVLADETAQFSLSELLFGLFPACVLPFLIRRMGAQRSHYLTLMTQPVLVQQAHAWGMVDAWEKQSGPLLRKHLLRLRRISKNAITRYKKYMSDLDDIERSKPLALSANRDVFSDAGSLKGIARYVETGRFPWEE
jgi:polyketide biosynthesis enoyl-CoA hydratase PksH